MSTILQPQVFSRPGNESSRGVAPISGSGMLPQETFLHMLCLERKRTERTGMRFVLMLLECDHLVKNNGQGDLFQQVLRALSRSTRETDIKGWYEHDSVLGVIFTDIGPADGRVVASALLARISGVVSSALTIEEINAIRLSFHVFPENSAENGHSGTPDKKLYPELEQKRERKQGARVLKRALDVIASLAGLTLILPLGVVIAAVIKATSPGPVLFRQPRIGQHGKTFTFLKFRSMYANSDRRIHEEYVKQFIAGGTPAESDKPVYKLTNDPRVTRVGRFLRRTSLDELPQFWNVLRGEMSLVGPRPPLPYEFGCYDLWHKRRLLSVKPGITGLWQVAGRSTVQFDAMVRLDLKYAQAWSFWLDLKILAQTPRAVFSGTGAY